MDLFEQRAIAPMLIAEERPAFDDPDWLFELKWDGSRTIAYLDPDAGAPRFENKRHKVLDASFPELREIHRQVQARCILDGEMLVLNPEKGTVDFAEMQRRSVMNNRFKIELAAAQLPVSFVAFDLLYLDGEDHHLRPLTQRKELLKQAVKQESDRMALARWTDCRGVELYRMAQRQGLEGIVAKRKDSLYHFGKRTKDWVKCKNQMDEDFIVCGYFFKSGERGRVTSINLGSFTEDGTIAYRGHVVMGISREDFRQVDALPKVEKEAHHAAFPDFEGAVWVEPRLVCTVKFMEYTKNGGLRQPVYKGLREDKAPEECRLDQ